MRFRGTRIGKSKVDGDTPSDTFPFLLQDSEGNPLVFSDGAQIAITHFDSDD